mmetsp:Transcript_1464/g.3890  ORF Transcript_1464/g.3890 Transcript_1464/m.3890 type:complete len:279 (+) Transcript_1464:1521-2357(+)
MSAMRASSVRRSAVPLSCASSASRGSINASKVGRGSSIVPRNSLASARWNVVRWRTWFGCSRNGNASPPWLLSMYLTTSRLMSSLLLLKPEAMSLRSPKDRWMISTSPPQYLRFPASFRTRSSTTSAWLPICMASKTLWKTCCLRFGSTSFCATRDSPCRLPSAYSVWFSQMYTLRKFSRKPMSASSSFGSALPAPLVLTSLKSTPAASCKICRLRLASMVSSPSRLASLHWNAPTTAAYMCTSHVSWCSITLISSVICSVPGWPALRALSSASMPLR